MRLGVFWMVEGADVVTTDVPVVPRLLSDEDFETVSVGTGLFIVVVVDGGKSVLLADD